MGLPAGTRLHGRTHSRCLTSPHLQTRCPRHNFSGCGRQASGSAHTCGENRRLHARGTSVTRVPCAGNAHARTHMHTHAHQKNGTADVATGTPEEEERVLEREDPGGSLESFRRGS